MRELTDESPFGNLIRTQLGIDLGRSLTIEGAIQLIRPDQSVTRIFRGKIDTGAYMSLLPTEAFEELQPSRFVRYELFGIQRIPECAVECAISRCTFYLVDSEGNKTSKLTNWIAFALKDDVPVLIGMKGILDSFDYSASTRKRVFQLMA